MIKLQIPKFESDLQMLAWCEEQGVTPFKDEAGKWDWQKLYDQRDEKLERLYGKRTYISVKKGESQEEFAERVKAKFRASGLLPEEPKPSGDDSPSSSD